MPIAAKASSTKQLQSTPERVQPPNRYGTPSQVSAAAITSDAGASAGRLTPAGGDALGGPLTTADVSPAPLTALPSIHGNSSSTAGTSSVRISGAMAHSITTTTTSGFTTRTSDVLVLARTTSRPRPG